MKYPRNKRLRLISPIRLCLMLAAGCIAFGVFPCAKTSGETTVTGIIDLVPGPDVYNPSLLVINHSTHRLYIASTGGRTIKLFDTIAQQVSGDIDLGSYSAVPSTVNVAGMAVDESAAPGGNKLYVAVNAAGGYYLRIIDCANNTNLTSEGSDISLPIGGTQNEAFSSITVNSANHK